ncbi:hypothetical protein L249_4636, partial [Ophiocordyceps polyrhachis-furcata BCC 54312]
MIYRGRHLSISSEVPPLLSTRHNLLSPKAVPLPGLIPVTAGPFHLVGEKVTLHLHYICINNITLSLSFISLFLCCHDRCRPSGWPMDDTTKSSLRKGCTTRARKKKTPSPSVPIMSLCFFR